MTVTEFRKNWGDAIRKAIQGESIPITSHGTHVATLGPAVGGPQTNENANGATAEVAGAVASGNGRAVRNKPKRNLKG